MCVLKADTHAQIHIYILPKKEILDNDHAKGKGRPIGETGPHSDWIRAPRSWIALVDLVRPDLRVSLTFSGLFPVCSDYSQLNYSTT